MNCKRCGKNVPIRSRVCPSCGLDNPQWQPRPEDIDNQPQQSRASTGYSNQPQQSNRAAAPQASQSQKAPQNAGTSSTASNNDKGSWSSVLLLVAIVVVIILVVKKCSSERLIGTWTGMNGELSMTFTDKENGYMRYNGAVSMVSDRTIDFTYRIDDDELIIRTETTLYYNGDEVRFTFDVSGDKLTLTETGTYDTQVFYKE